MSTISVLKACTGGYVGAGHVHPALTDAVRQAVSEAKEAGTVSDGYVARCGDDLALILLHDHPLSSPVIRGLGRDAFARAGAVGRRLAQHAASLNGGPELTCVEMAFSPRPSEPVLCFLADKAGAGAWNVYLYRAFADPFNSPTLLEDPRASEGFSFLMGDPAGMARAYDLPADLHPFLADASTGGIVREVRSRGTGLQAAAASDGDDPALIVRCHEGLPGVGEVLEAFSFPYTVTGWMGGIGPLMPVASNDEAMTRSDGPPRAVGLGFQVSEGRLVGPRDLLGDRAFDEARRQALAAADYLRRQGPFAPRTAEPSPARLPTV